MYAYRRHVVWLVLVAVGSWLVLGHGYVHTRSALYALIREYRRITLIQAKDHWQSLEGRHFRVFYTPGDREGAILVLEAAETAHAPVVQAFDYIPAKRTVIVVHPNRETLRQAFGWAQGDSATGVYFGGVIRVLSPTVWISGETPAQRRGIFQKVNPLTHEYTHLVLDYLTDGNYPRWFTEGLAQRLEYQATGYRWLERGSTLRQRLYTLAELTDQFDELPNQALAYRQSHLLVDYLAESCGAGGLQRVVAGLAGKRPFDQALRDACGVGPGALERQWLRWIEAHRDTLDTGVPR